MGVMRASRLFSLTIKVWFLWSFSVLAQNSESANESICFQELGMPWQQHISQSTAVSAILPDLIVIRTIQPGGLQQVYYQSGNESFKAQGIVNKSWSIAENSDPKLGEFISAHWSALRDDLVKPFRFKQKNEEGSDKFESPTNLDKLKNDRSLKDYTYAYSLYYRNICVLRQFELKDFDEKWAEENANYIFNQTLKLTEMHRIMESAFL